MYILNLVKPNTTEKPERPETVLILLSSDTELAY